MPMGLETENIFHDVSDDSNLLNMLRLITPGMVTECITNGGKMAPGSPYLKEIFGEELT